MTAEAVETRQNPVRPSPATIHPAWVRVTHWINAVAILVMIGSGWQIYDASPLPLFKFVFPTSITLGGWLAAGIAWHLAGMWVFVLNGIVYVTLGLATGRFRAKLLPIRPREVARDLFAALRGRLAHDDLAAYNAVQKLLYLAVICTGVVIVLSGISIWKPVQFQELTALFGGYDRARYVHFFAMSTFVAFLAVHILLALIVPRSLRAMITGR
jgi:thiosulfate reductase cytochrome b subunit